MEADQPTLSAQAREALRAYHAECVERCLVADLSWACSDDAAEAPDSPAAVQRPTGPRGSESLDVPPPPAVASPVRSTPSPEEMAAAAAAARPVQSSWLADMEQGVEEEASSDRQASADQLGAGEGGEGGEGGVAAGVGLGGPADDDDDDDFTVERAPTRR